MVWDGILNQKINCLSNCHIALWYWVVLHTNYYDISCSWVTLTSYGSDSPGREFWPKCGPFLKKVEPSCDQTRWYIFDFSIDPGQLCPLHPRKPWPGLGKFFRVPHSTSVLALLSHLWVKIRAPVWPNLQRSFSIISSISSAVRFVSGLVGYRWMV